MRKNQFEKLGWFEKILHDFFIHAGREHLPWRKPRITAYEVWVSEIMLQQTQVSRVIGYYERFLGRFPTVRDLAKASWEDFLPYYAGLGYYARGKNMLKAAKAVVETFDGSFPNDVEKLETLPGVGPYTAAAIASFAYGKNTIAWDTNLRRVVGRFFFGSKKADIPFIEFEEAFQLPAKELNGALMDFGSAICTARPKCGACPLREKCLYFREKGKNELTTYNSRLTTIESKVKGQKSKVKPSAGEQNSTLSFKDARVLLTLHEGHRKYYSSKKRGYSPFIVPSSHNTRAGIKDWFRDRYGLELSVRPPHDKNIVDGKPTLSVHAQILLGKPDFLIFKKEDIGHEEQ